MFDLIRYFTWGGRKASHQTIGRIIIFQIAADLFILTVILHYSGGVENPFYLYFVFHMVLTSVFLSRFQSYILATLAIAVPAYMLTIALMTAIGAAVTTTQEGQSVSAIFFILHLAPLYISWIFINDPHGTLAVGLSILPFTALMTTGMRNLFTIVPAWQIMLSVAVQVACALGALWLAGRALRLGMLRYGQRLSLRGLLGRSSYREKTI